MFCKKCGRMISTARICPYCRAIQWQDDIPFVDFSQKRFYTHQEADISTKSRSLAGLLQIFLGAFGVGRFYLGYRKQAFFHILITFLTFGIGGFLWGLFDGLMILDKKVLYDASGKFLKV